MKKELRKGNFQQKVKKKTFPLEIHDFFSKGNKCVENKLKFIFI